MREIRPSGSEGGGDLSLGSPYPYPTCATRPAYYRAGQPHWGSVTEGDAGSIKPHRSTTHEPYRLAR